MNRQHGIAFAILLCIGARHTESAACGYKRYRHEYFVNDGRTFPNGLQCKSCGFFGDPNCNSEYNTAPLCESLAQVRADHYLCDDTFNGTSEFYSSVLCPCSPSFLEAVDDLPDGGIEAISYACSGSCGVCTLSTGNEPQACDGRECDVFGRVDEACGDDEHSCTKAHGQDGFPVNLVSGEPLVRSCRESSHHVILNSHSRRIGVRVHDSIRFTRSVYLCVQAHDWRGPRHGSQHSLLGRGHAFRR
jgi:hypothetical protein